MHGAVLYSIIGVVSKSTSHNFTCLVMRIKFCGRDVLTSISIYCSNDIMGASEQDKQNLHSFHILQLSIAM